MIESCRTYSEQLNMADCVDKLRSVLLDCQAGITADEEIRVNVTLQVKSDIKQRLIQFESGY